MSNAYLETLDRMEPDIDDVDLTAAAASIAISLKRLADYREAELKIMNQYRSNFYGKLAVKPEGKQDAND